MPFCHGEFLAQRGIKLRGLVPDLKVARLLIELEAANESAFRINQELLQAPENVVPVDHLAVGTNKAAAQTDISAHVIQ